MADVLNDKGVLDNEGEFGKYVLQELKLPASHSTPEAKASYARYGKRVHWLDGSVIPGAFQMNTSWYFKENTWIVDQPLQNGSNFLKPHTHEVGEILGFYGSDPQHPEELGGEIIFYIGGEKHILTKSSLLYMPAGLEHGPLVIKRVDRPIFHFSVVMENAYRVNNTEGGIYEAK